MDLIFYGPKKLIGERSFNFLVGFAPSNFGKSFRPVRDEPGIDGPSGVLASINNQSASLT
jgi:hypothetical protein